MDDGGLKVSKVVKLIDFQEEIQRTPKEILDYMADEITAGNCSHVLVLFRNEKKAFYVSGSDERNYKNSEILWDMLQFQNFFIGQ